MIYYNPRDPRNLHLASVPYLPWAARTAMGDDLGFTIARSHTSLKNTVTFTRADVNQVATRWAKMKTEQPGKRSYFDFRNQGETHILSLYMASETYKVITMTAFGPEGNPDCSQGTHLDLCSNSTPTCRGASICGALRAGDTPATNRGHHYQTLPGGGRQYRSGDPINPHGCEGFL